MYDFFEIEDDQLLLKKWHKGHLITLYLKVEGLNLNLLDNYSIKKIIQLTKQIPLLSKERKN
tara:strand:- start:930 stop:1115 length:186 start_codon:yes stop_codon:yes gene_type:complete